ncbi:MAG: hypothetical protein ABIN67_22035 [Ferruginibacter sp.]
MKHVATNVRIGLVIILLGFLGACAASKEGRSMKKTINGDWTLQTINVEGINSKFKAKVFNEADFNCFIGSTWNFVSNNSMGSYTLAGGASGCDAITRNIRWSIYEPKGAEKEFQFKRLDEKKNPMDDNNGFRLSVGALSENTMQLRSSITFEGKSGTFVYNFVKK